MEAFSVRKVTGDDPRRVEALVDLHREVYPPRMQYADSRRYFADALENPSHINIVAEKGDGTLVGYALGVPQPEVVEELRPHDPGMRDDPGRLYLDTIQIHRRYRGQGLSLSLIRVLCAEAEKRGFFHLCMHARSSTGWNRRQHAIFASARTLRRIENWFGSGETFDYIEASTTLLKGREPLQ